MESTYWWPHHSSEWGTQKEIKLLDRSQGISVRTEVRKWTRASVLMSSKPGNCLIHLWIPASGSSKHLVCYKFSLNVSGLGMNVQTRNVVRCVLFLPWQPWVHAEPRRFLSVWLLWLGEALCRGLDITIHHGLPPSEGEGPSLRLRKATPDSHSDLLVFMLMPCGLQVKCWFRVHLSPKENAGGFLKLFGKNRSSQ